VTRPAAGEEAGGEEDPNRTVGGARQRVGPFWIEEPRWYWLLFALILLVAIALFGLALGFDHP
jgi:hypothetical protein